MKTQTPIRPDSELAAEFWEKGRSESCPIYDMHGHMGEWHSIYFPRAEAAQMVRSMDGAGVRLVCFAHHAALFSPQIGNRVAVEAVRQFPDRLRAYLSVNPHYPDALEGDLAGFDDMRDVYVGLKLLPDYHKVPISAEPYRRALEFADERGLLVLSHTWGGSNCDGEAEVRRVAERYPNLRLLMGHSLNDHWHEAAAIVRDYPNTYAELTSIPGRRGVLELLCEEAGSDRILYGTDIPWFDEHQGVGSLLSADITEDDIHNILHRNAEKLLGL